MPHPARPGALAGSNSREDRTEASFYPGVASHSAALTLDDPGCESVAAVSAVSRARTSRPGFEEAVRAHGPALASLAERLCRSKADARDLIQDTYERALRAWDRLPPGANERGWLITICHNLFIDRCRRARRLPRTDGRDVMEAPAPEVVSPPPWSEVTPDQVRQALTELDEEFRRAYELHAIAGRSYREIAEELGVPPSTVGTRLLRARQKLKTILLARMAAEGTEGKP